MNKFNIIKNNWNDIVPIKIWFWDGYNTELKAIKTTGEVTGLLHELGHFIDHCSGRTSENLGLTDEELQREMSNLFRTSVKLQRVELIAWRYAFELALIYDISLDSFIADLTSSLGTYHVSLKRLNMIANGMRQRANKIQKMLNNSLANETKAA